MLQPTRQIDSAGGAWALRGGVASPLGGDGPATPPGGGGPATRLGGGGPPVLLVPGERVLVLAVDLPLPSRRQRIEALPFAVEERLAGQTGAAHLALGAPVAEGRYLAGVVAPDLMAEWIAAAGAAGIGDAAIVPDALALPAPESGWTVARDGGRVLVRQADGTGFAAPESRLEALWEAAGKPALTETALDWHAPAVLPLDLRQGVFAAARADTSLWRKAAMVAGIGLAAHALIAAADIAALKGIAARWQAETASLVALARPGANLQDETLAETATALVPADAGGPPGTFLPLMTRASAALVRAPGASVQRVAFEGGAVSLTLAGDVPRGVAALAAAGLAPRRAGGAIMIGGGR